ncbi:MAG: recombinase family protein, partial [Clostridia bacterium]|nr:recombinase family protein [Clostridia bacterium]
QEMIADAQQREFQLVVVHRMDRWARNVDDARYYKKYLKRYGIKIVSAIEEFDETPEGEFFELMSMGMAELYSKKLARECVAGKIANAREGKIHGGTPPLGYTVKGKFYVIDETEVDAVKIIFDLFLKGYGYRYIRDYLNSNGYRHSDGRLFTNHFYDILRNRKYIGEYIYNRSATKDENGKRNNHNSKPTKEIICIAGGMPQIIDTATFYKVQAILDERRGNHNYARTRKYLLSGLIRCAQCGRAMSGELARAHEVNYTVYRCGTHSKSCDTSEINADYLNDYIHSLLFNCLLSPDNLENLCELIKVCYIKALDKLKEKQYQLHDEISQANNAIKMLADELSEDASKYMQQYLMCKIDKATANRKRLQINVQFLEDEMTAFPEYNIKSIKRNAKLFSSQLKNREFTPMQKTFRMLISEIRINNSTVETTINLHALLDTPQPIRCTVIEQRDHIGLYKCHYKQALVFSKLTIRV